MNNWKAVILGVIATTTLLLSSQLIFILIAAYIGGAKDELAFLSEHKEALWRVLALLSFGISLFIGGMITAFLAQKKPVASAMIAGGVACSLSLLTTLEGGQLTLTSALLVILGIMVAAAGGYFYKKRFL